MKAILCPIDGSEPALRAATIAADMARGAGGTLHLVAIEEYVIGRTGVYDTLTPEDAQAALDQAREAVEAAGHVAIETALIRARESAPAILDYAGTHGITHIVIGSTGKGGFKKFLLGSTSSDVVRKAHCPVTVVH